MTAAALPPGAVARSRPVKPSAIERELSELWMAEADARREAGDGEKPLSRTLLHTLVVYSPDVTAAEEARQAAAALSARQPSRSIFVALRPGAAGLLDAEVTLYCAAPLSGHDQVCGEQVMLNVGPEAVRGLAGAVLPLLLTNVPSFLWWQHDNPMGMLALDDLAPAIDRLIVDSMSFEAPAAGLAELAGAVADPAFLPVVSDLSWARLASWRYQVAQIFDAPALRPYLGRITNVRLATYVGTPVLAWLLGAWLATRLGWEAGQWDEAGLALKSGQHVRFDSLPLMPGVEPGWFAGVTLEAGDGSRFEVRRMGSTCTETSLALGRLQTERVVPLREESLSAWLGHELNRLGRSPTYEAALRLLADSM